MIYLITWVGRLTNNGSISNIEGNNQTLDFSGFYSRTRHEANRNGEYWRGAKAAIKDGTVGRLADVFRAQLDAAGSSTSYADGRLLLDAFHRAGTQYTIRKDILLTLMLTPVTNRIFVRYMKRL